MDERTADRTPDTGQDPRPAGPVLSAREAAAVLGISERTVRRAVARGDLPAAKHGGVYRIARADIARYRERRRVPAPSPARAITDPPCLIASARRTDESASTFPRPL